MEDHAIYAHRGEWANQRTVAIESDTFQNGFRLGNTANDVVAMRLEQILFAAFSGSSSLSCHFWPFTCVLSGIGLEVTGTG